MQIDFLVLTERGYEACGTSPVVFDGQKLETSLNDYHAVNIPIVTMLSIDSEMIIDALRTSVIPYLTIDYKKQALQ
jgi:hypothetical protein